MGKGKGMRWWVRGVRGREEVVVVGGKWNGMFEVA
jgi:hypothetical protein